MGKGRGHHTEGGGHKICPIANGKPAVFFSFATASVDRASPLCLARHRKNGPIASGAGRLDWRLDKGGRVYAVRMCEQSARKRFSLNIIMLRVLSEMGAAAYAQNWATIKKWSAREASSELPQTCAKVTGDCAC
jgi:hypothetical protein